MLATGPMLILSRNSLPAKNLKELIAWLKANPDSVTFGTGGLASPPHISGLSLQKVTGNKFQFVPFRGSAPALQNVLAGQLDIIIDQASARALDRARRRRARLCGDRRKSGSPRRRTSRPSTKPGCPGFHVSIWQGLWAPKGTPKEIIAKINAAVVEALADPAVQKRLKDIGQELPSREQQTPEGFGAYHKAEIEKWWPIIKAANIKPAG